MEKYTNFSVVTNHTVFKKGDFSAADKGAFREILTPSPDGFELMVATF